jgi:hypothetical protein
MRKTTAITALALVLAAGGCSAGREKGVAESGVAVFHQMLDAGRYHDIYAGADPEYRSTASEQEGTQVLQMVHDRLGAFRSSQEKSWRVNYGTVGNVVNLTYDSQFASGAGTEDFVFRVDGSAAHLVGYHVHSPALAGSGAATPAAAAKPEGEAAPPPAAPVAPAEAPKPAAPADGK